MRAFLVAAACVVLCVASVLAQPVLLQEDFSGGLPTGWQIIYLQSDYGVSGGVLDLAGGCALLPGTYERSRGIAVDVDFKVDYWSQAYGDFNIYVFYEPFAPGVTNCHTPGANGYGFNIYPVMSDNGADTIGGFVNWNPIPNWVQTPTTTSVNEWHHARAEAAADGTLRLLIDGREVLRTNDRQLTRGRIALRAYFRVYMDNVRVSELCTYAPASGFTAERVPGSTTHNDFSWSSCGGPGLMTIDSQDASSATVTLNGMIVARPDDFNHSSKSWTIPVSLNAGTNTVNFALGGKPGTKVSVHLNSAQ